MPYILLVDDDADWLFLIRQHLQKKGWSVNTSLSGIDLWNKVLDHMPDMILLDINMSPVTGEVYCKGLKADDRTSQIPIVFLSSNSDIQDCTKRSGADGFIRKPLILEKFNELLLSYVT